MSAPGTQTKTPKAGPQTARPRRPPVDNQHRQITGYRELDQTEIEAMNGIKGYAADAGELVERMRADGALDQRWVSIGATQLQQGFMALTRAVAKPESF